jgi:hypothetical protein
MNTTVHTTEAQYLMTPKPGEVVNIVSGIVYTGVLHRVVETAKGAIHIQTVRHGVLCGQYVMPEVVIGYSVEG